MKKKIAVIDYNMGNLHSVLRAWQEVGADAYLAKTPLEAQDASGIVFPGQGCMVDAMKSLADTKFDVFIKDWIKKDKPFFGICLGLQALFDFSQEGNVDCLGIFKGKIKKFVFNNENGEKSSLIKVPHMGWNNVCFSNEDSSICGIDKSLDQFYFVHSYYLDLEDKSLQWATTTYGQKTFVSAIKKSNCYATQFHPEKSQKKGLLLYKNFLDFTILP